MDKILVSFSIVVMLNSSNVTTTGTTISTMLTVFDSFSSWILTMTAALKCIETRIAGNTGSGNILPLAPMGTERNKNTLLPLRMEVVILIPVKWVFKVIGCCGCVRGSSNLRVGAM